MAESLADLKRAKSRQEVIGCVLKPNPPGKTLHIHERLYPRKEIDRFIEDEDCANLFFLALLEMQDGKFNVKDVHHRAKAEVVEGDDFSYWSLAAIHGYPFNRPWAGVDYDRVRNAGYQATFPPIVPPPNADPTRAGYCHHATVLFPTWHRAYIALFEQTIQLKMYEIAERWEDDEVDLVRMRAAANRFRFPYWDPLQPRMHQEHGSKRIPLGVPDWECGVPRIFSEKTVSVFLPKEDKATRFPRRNPLYNYLFPKGEGYDYKDTKRFDWSALWSTPGWAALPEDHAMRVNLAEALHTPDQMTMRCPNIKGQSDHIALNSRFSRPTFEAQIMGMIEVYSHPPRKHIVRDLGDSLLRVLTEDRPYHEFSRRAQGSQSFEDWHDLIHGAVGIPWDRTLLPHTQPSFLNHRLGHMSLPPISSFDPIFWMHHCNAERVFCMWQILWPNNWDFGEGVPLHFSSMAEQFEVQTPNADYPLLPFWRTNIPGQATRFWTSNELKDGSIFGSCYEERPGMILEDMSQKDLKAWVTTLYGWTQGLDFMTFQPPTRTITGFPRNLNKAPVFGGKVLVDGHSVRDLCEFDNPGLLAPFPPPVPAGAAHQEPFREWTVRFDYEKFALNGRFSIWVFIGDVEHDKPHQWGICKSFVNWVTNFTQPNQGCQNCVNQTITGLIVSSTVDLTQTLESYVGRHRSLNGVKLRSMESEDVMPFLQRNLHWRVENKEGIAVETGKIDRFQGVVLDRMVSPPDDIAEFTTYSPYAMHTVTQLP